jgi:pimeloyl-ACP methyl ester carboxylesterase
MGIVNSTPYGKHSVVSRDGTTIGYRQLGSGPGLVLVHGGMQASQNFMKLATALSDDFAVYVLDRRGRGMSGPFGNDYGLQRECEDLQAVLLQTNTQFVFGLSSGAIICLQAALTVPEIRKAALYEPPLPISGSSPASWVDAFDTEIAKGDLGAALVTALKGTETSRVFDLIPRAILVPLMRHAVRAADPTRVMGDDVHPLALIPTMHYDAQLVREMEGKLEQFKDVNVEVLLLGGSRSPLYLRHALAALAGVLPKCRRVKLGGVGHIAADNGGKPELVARELRRFFGTPMVGVSNLPR